MSFSAVIRSKSAVVPQSPRKRQWVSAVSSALVWAPFRGPTTAEQRKTGANPVCSGVQFGFDCGPVGKVLPQSSEVVPQSGGLVVGKSKKQKKGRMSAPVSLPAFTWDHGATGAANRIGLVVEDAAEFDVATGEAPNPNGVKRARRVDMIEVWHRKGRISAAAFNAAEALRDAFEATMRAPGWPDNDRVQSSPKPDKAVEIQIDRLSRYAAFARFVHRDDWPIIDACVLRQGTPATFARAYRGPGYGAGIAALAQALDRVAAAMCQRT